jgi:hypothetical protein
MFSRTSSITAPAGLRIRCYDTAKDRDFPSRRHVRRLLIPEDLPYTALYRRHRSKQAILETIRANKMRVLHPSGGLSKHGDVGVNLSDVRLI